MGAGRRARRPITLTRGCAAGVLGPALGGHVGDLEVERAQPLADEPRARLVLLAGRVDGGDADQGGGEVDDLVGGVVDALGHPANDVGMQGHAPISWIEHGAWSRANTSRSRRRTRSIGAGRAEVHPDAQSRRRLPCDVSLRRVRCRPPLAIAGRSPAATTVRTAGPDARGLTAVDGLRGGLDHAHRAAHRLHRDRRRRRGRRRRRVAARRRARHARNRPARSRQHGRQGERRRARRAAAPSASTPPPARCAGSRSRTWAGTCASPRCRSCRPRSCSTCRWAAIRRCGPPPTAATRPRPRPPAGPVQEGSIGAGAGATVGKSGGPGRSMKAGLGSYAIAMPNGLVVAAIVAVNAVGDIIDPDTGQGRGRRAQPRRHARRRAHAAARRPAAADAAAR